MSKEIKVTDKRMFTPDGQLHREYRPLEKQTLYRMDSLHDAANEGDLRAVRRLLDQGAEVNWKDKSGFTALNRAAWRGHTEVVRLLLNRGADVNAPYPPLYSGAMHYGVVKLLLDRGAYVNAKTKNGETALHFAAEKGFHDVIKLLLDRGADINARRWDGKTPTDVSVGESTLGETFVFLKARGGKMSSDLDRAAASNKATARPSRPQPWWRRWMRRTRRP